MEILHNERTNLLTTFAKLENLAKLKFLTSLNCSNELLTI